MYITFGEHSLTFIKQNKLLKIVHIKYLEIGTCIKNAFYKH